MNDDDDGNFPFRGEEGYKMRQGLKRRRARAKEKTLAELAKTANFEHRLSVKHRGQARDHDKQRLEHAKLAGDALAEAKKKHKRGTWGPWLTANFKAGERTARVYIQLAAKWDDPDIKKAREKGTITSIKTFLDTAKKPKPGHEVPKESSPMELTDEQVIRSDIKNALLGGLRKLSKDDLQKFDEHASELWDEVLKKFNVLKLSPREREAIENFKKYLVYYDPEYGFEKSDEQEKADRKKMKRMGTRKSPSAPAIRTESLRKKSALKPSPPTRKNKTNPKD